MVRCWASPYCKKKSEAECTDICTGYLLLQTLYNQSKMPPRYQYGQKLVIEKADDKAYTDIKKFRDEILENVSTGKGLFLYGTTGTGKTSLLCAIMNEYFRKVAFTSMAECVGIYLHVPSFLEDYRKSYGNESVEFIEFLENVHNAKMVIFDDIGAEKPSDWVRERLLSIIDTRVNNCHTNLFTSNLTMKQLEGGEILGSRIASRILGSTSQYEFKGADKRRVGVVHD